jgi:alkylation response protein AidB-like acyl-CoA dehydrogenase
VASVDDNAPLRNAVREWIAAHPRPTGRELAEAGYVAPHWPPPWGLGADPAEQLIVDEELAAAGITRPDNQIGIGWAGPTILRAGDDEQRQRYLLPMLSGEEIWCQLFSEPGAGSDLAGLTTRAERDGDEFVVNGQKIWTSGAHLSAFGILLARTNPPGLGGDQKSRQKRRGISYFICPMDLPGIEIRKIVDMTGNWSFNEVFLTDVRIPASCLVGELDDGWRLAKLTLGNERVSLSTGGVRWGRGPTALDVVGAARRAGPIVDATLRQRVAGVYTEHVVLDLFRQRTAAARLAGEQPGPESSIRKLLGDHHGQHVMELARDLLGPGAMLTGSVGDGELDRAEWHTGFLFSRALTIGGGTAEVQRNIIAERLLGLPSDPA